MRYAHASCLIAVALLAIAVPVAADDSFESGEIEGSGELDIRTHAGTLAFEDDVLSADISLSAQQARLEIVNDTGQVVEASAGGGSVQPASNSERNETVHHFEEPLDASIDRVIDQGVVIVKPWAGPNDVNVQTEAGSTASPVDRRVLDESHFVTEHNTGGGSFYYNHTVQDAIAVQPEGPTEVEVTGSLQVYLWGVEASLSTSEGSSAVETGHWSRDHSQGLETVKEDHYVHANLYLEGASLTVETADASSLSLFSESYELDPADEASLRFPNASGELATAEAVYDGTGETLVAEDGSFDVAFTDEATLAVDARDSPAQVHGWQPVDEGPLEDKRTWGWSLLGVVGAVGVGLGAAWLHPKLRSAQAWWRQRRIDAWMHSGDRLTSVRDYQGAHDAYAKVTERYPEVTEAWYSKGLVLQEMGRHAEASQTFREANRQLGEDEPELVELAAREAWRAGDVDESSTLFRELYGMDAERVRECLQDPEFEELKNRAWVRNAFKDEGQTMVSYA
jgi:tetratricopeptide (TPR) repeat protein